MAQLNSKIIIANGIKLDRTYKNVIDYTQTDMVSLCESNKIKEANHYSFIKHGANKIAVDFTYSECLQASYLAFQNYDYNNKWFFAFIDSIEFSSPASTIITFTVDVFSTWFRNVEVKPCFVVREHVNNDTLGLHTIDEGLEFGDYKIATHNTDSVNTTLEAIIGCTEDYMDNYKTKVNNYNGIFTPLTYYGFTDKTSFQGTITGLQSNNKIDTIANMFLCPSWILTHAPDPGGVRIIDDPDVVYQDIQISRISTLDGYTPKNNKMLCFPYCYIGLSNILGQYNMYKQELWELTNTSMEVRMYGALASGASIRVVPKKYKGDSYAWDESITLGKFPSLAWANDAYTNWLTQNGVNILGLEINAETAGYLGGALMVGAGASVGNYTMVGAGIASMWNTMQTNNRMSKTPAGVRGSLNSGDVVTSAEQNVLHIYRVTIKEEFAKICDQFLTKFGYKVTTLKSPNITGRTYWNYVQIGGSEVIGYGNIPADAMDEINRIFRDGVTIWHNHTNIGDYSLNNTIVQNP